MQEGTSNSNSLLFRRNLPNNDCDTLLGLKEFRKREKGTHQHRLFPNVTQILCLAFRFNHAKVIITHHCTSSAYLFSCFSTHLPFIYTFCWQTTWARFFKQTKPLFNSRVGFHNSVHHHSYAFDSFSIFTVSVQPYI